jgi:hypothetical protein
MLSWKLRCWNLNVVFLRELNKTWPSCQKSLSMPIFTYCYSRFEMSIHFNTVALFVLYLTPHENVQQFWSRLQEISCNVPTDLEDWHTENYSITWNTGMANTTTAFLHAGALRCAPLHEITWSTSSAGVLIRDGPFYLALKIPAFHCVSLRKLHNLQPQPSEFYFEHTV